MAVHGTGAALDQSGQCVTGFPADSQVAWCAALVEAGEAQFLVTGEAKTSEILCIYIYILHHIKVITGNQPRSLDLNFQLKSIQLIMETPWKPSTLNIL